MLLRDSTIVALATPLGYSALAIIRVSGKDTFSILDKVFKGKIKPSEAKPNSILFGYIVNPEDNSTVDQILLNIFKTPKSFTGEDMVEINCHGGLVLFQKIIDLLVEFGCDLAEAGEFSKRAFFHHKMDLTQAESIHDLIFSKSFKASQLLLSTLKKNFGRKLESFKKDLLSLVAKIEVNIDYSEEDIEVWNQKDQSKLLKLITEIEQLIEHSKQTQRLHSGYKVSIVGKPNAGKSSLLNLLIGEEKAIVSSIEGTTRDPIEVTFSLKDIPVTFIDTAGIRDNSDNEIEILGIKKTMEILQNSDFVIFVQDVVEYVHQNSPIKEKEEVIAMLNDLKIPYLTLLNKTDLLEKSNLPDLKDHLLFSCYHNENGLELLKQKLEKELPSIALTDSQFYINQRQTYLLNSILKHLKEAQQLIDGQQGEMLELELISFALQHALTYIAELDGSSVKEEILETIFSNFCIGK